MIVHGQKTHDQRLPKTIEHLRQHGLTLNATKCQFNVNRLVFMGVLLSEKGIAPTEEGVKTLEQHESLKLSVKFEAS